MAVMTEPEALEELRERMIGQRSDAGATVIDVKYEYLINEDAEEYLNVVLVLSNPLPDREIWPVDDVFDWSGGAGRRWSGCGSRRPTSSHSRSCPIPTSWTTRSRRWTHDRPADPGGRAARLCPRASLQLFLKLMVGAVKIAKTRVP